MYFRIYFDRNAEWAVTRTAGSHDSQTARRKYTTSRSKHTHTYTRAGHSHRHFAFIAQYLRNSNYRAQWAVRLINLLRLLPYGQAIAKFNWNYTGDN